jgi:hypothetical protein
MGDKLLQYYKIVDERVGMAARARLAMKTSVPSAKAGEAPDSPELLAKFHAAVEDIVGASIPKL